MPYWYRRTRDGFSTTLSTAATLATTTMTSTEFTGLPSDYSTDSYLPLTLINTTTEVFEIVWVVAHTAASDTVTVERGKEGTAAQAWPAGTLVMCTPTIRDANAPVLSTGLPTDYYVGERHTLTNQGRTVVGTRAAGWQPDVGAANPADYGLRQDGTAIPSSGVVIVRGGQHALVTDASGHVQVTYTTPFPNGTLHVAPVFVGGGTPPFLCIGVVSGSHTASGFKIFLYRSDTGAFAGSGISLTVSYLATGY